MEVRLGYKLTDVGVIPEDWEVQPFEKLAHIERGKFTARPRNDPKYYGGDIPFIQTGDVRNASGNITSYSQTLNSKGLRVSKLFPSGTLFFTIAANIGDVGIAAFDTACPDSLVAIRPTKKTDKTWLSYELAKRKASFENIATHNAQLNINLEKLRPYKLPVPPPSEQRAIAEALSDVDRLLGGLDRLIAKKRDLKQAAMQQLLTPQATWEVADLETIADVIDPHPSHRAPDKVVNGIPFVGIGDLDENGEIVGTKIRLVDPSVHIEHLNRYDLQEELIGLGRVASIGKVVRLKPESEDYVISPTLGIIRATKVSRGFLLYSLRSSFVTDQFRRIMSGSTRSSVGMVVLRHLRIVKPPAESEQNAIAGVLSDMDAEIAALEARLEKTRALKQGMMQQLLTGRIRLVKPQQAEATS